LIAVALIERDVLKPVSALGPERLLLPIHQDKRRTSGGGERQPPKAAQTRTVSRPGVASSARSRVSSGNE
jgi:hypothetical protein